MDLSTLTLGPTSVIQSIVPDLLEKTPDLYYKQVIAQLEDNVKVIKEHLSKTPGLHLIEPQGAMYVMVGLDASLLGDDVEFSTNLVEEESVFVLPGRVFEMPNYIRIVITSPREILKEACERIHEFCVRKAKR